MTDTQEIKENETDESFYKWIEDNFYFETKEKGIYHDGIRCYAENQLREKFNSRNEKFVYVWRERGQLFVKCKNVSVDEIRVAQEKFLSEEK